MFAEKTTFDLHVGYEASSRFSNITGFFGSLCHCYGFSPQGRKKASPRRSRGRRVSACLCSRGRAVPQQQPTGSRRSLDAWGSSSPVAGDAVLLRSAVVSNRLLNFHGKPASLEINSSSQGTQGKYPQWWGSCSRDPPWG